MKKLRLFLLLGIFVLLVCLFGGMVTAVAAADTSHTVTFYVDGAEYNKQDISHGGYAMVPITPTKNDDIFSRWTVDGQKFSFKTPITSDVDVYAEWYGGSTLVFHEEMFTVEFRVDGWTVNTQNVKRNGSVVAPTEFALPEGKAFVRWEGSYTNVTADTVVNAVLADKEYTVYVYGFGGALLARRTVGHGGSIALDSLDTDVPHYLLDTDDALAQLSNVTADKDVHLAYTPAQYDVTFYSEGVQYGAAQQVEYGQVARFPAIPQKAKHIFIGWYLDLSDEAMYNFGTPVEGDVDLYAKYIAIENKKYTVKFYSYDGTQYGGTQKIEEGKTAILPGTPYRDGYNFLGWYVEGEVDAPFDFATGITADTNLYAMFEARTYTVTFQDGDTVLATSTVRYGQAATAPTAPAKTGYDFVGWDATFKVILRDTVINAMYKAKTYAVMFFDYNYRKIGATQYVAYGQSAVAPNAPQRVGYTFVGWQPEFDDVTDDIAVFPVYEKNKYTYTYLDGTSTVDTVEVEYGARATMPDVDKDGYVFVGWFIQGTDTKYDFNTTVTAARTLEARWQKILATTHTVRFMVDGMLYNRQIVEEGTAATAPADPTKLGHTFVGWDVAFDNVTADLVVTATFTVNTYTYTYVVDGVVVDSAQYQYNQVSVAPAAPTKTGYDFLAWKEPSGATFTFGLPVQADATLTAEFAPKYYNVTFVVNGKPYETQSVAYGTYAHVPYTPFVSGYAFKGWYVGNEAYDFASPVTADIEIAARLEAVLYNLYVYLDGAEYDVLEYTAGTALSLAAPDYDPELYVFSGWLGLPDTMPASVVIVRGTLIPRARHTLAYYIDGYLYSSYQYTEGSAIVAEPAPVTNEVYVFNGWLGLPDVMPTTDVKVEADVTYYRYIRYYLEGRLVATRKVLAGASVEPKDALADTEAYAFVEWSNEPTTMPDKDVRVDAVIANYYTITYLVEGKTYTTQKVLGGDAIPAVADPASAYWTFAGWSGLPATMPYGNVEVTAILTDYVRYALNFYVDGTLFAQVYLRPADPVIYDVGTPADTDAYVFVEWDDVPAIMPAEAVDVNAIIKRYYTVIYRVENSVYDTQKVLEGETIPAVVDPDIKDVEFYGWLGLPEGNVMPRGNLTVNADTKRYYNISYYVEGLFYTSQKVLEGEAIPAVDEPSGDDWVFLSWADLPATMPARNVSISARVQALQRYAITYYLAGAVYKTVRYLEGEEVVPEGDPAASESYEFYGWTDEPATMPAEDVAVYADVKYYRYIRYLVDGRVQKQQKVLEGESVVPDAPTFDDIVVSQWADLPDVMPEHDVDAVAVYRRYYTVSYFVGKVQHATQRVLEGDAIPAVDDPVGEDVVFVGWLGLPDVMPAKDLVVTADVKRYYTVTYYVDTRQYGEVQRVLEGDAVPAVADPDLDERTFVGWEGLPADGIMPAYNLMVTAIFEATELPLNNFVLNYADGVYTLSLTGEVEVGGIVGSVYTGTAPAAVTVADTVNTDYVEYAYPDRYEVRFAWSLGTNATQPMTILTFHAKEGEATVVISQIYAFDEGGNIVVASYKINGK